MSTMKRITASPERTPEEVADELAVREEYQRLRPSRAQLEAEGATFQPLSEVVELQELLRALRAERERQQLTLADVAARTGMSEPALSRLETGRAGNPTIQTLQRIAAALGRRVQCSLTPV